MSFLSIYDMGMNGKLKEVSFGQYNFYISYNTIVAFYSPKKGLVISENVWSNTTGKHLSAINPDKSVRVPYTTFEEELRSVEQLLSEKLEYDKVVTVELVNNEV